MKRVALYCRVSTHNQDTQNQVRALHEHAARAGWIIVGEYCDTAVSGTRERRPGLDALMDDARRRKSDLIAVAALDRLGRNLRHLVTLLDELQHLGVGLVSLREALDLTSPIGRAMFALVGALNLSEHERKGSAWGDPRPSVTPPGFGDCLPMERAIARRLDCWRSPRAPSG